MGELESQVQDQIASEEAPKEKVDVLGLKDYNHKDNEESQARTKDALLKIAEGYNPAAGDEIFVVYLQKIGDSGDVKGAVLVNGSGANRFLAAQKLLGIPTE